MNWDRVAGNWKQFKGKVKEQWGRLTDDQLDVIGGQREQLAGRVQEVYGISREEAERQITDFERAQGDWDAPDASAASDRTSAQDAARTSADSRTRDPSSRP